MKDPDGESRAYFASVAGRWDEMREGFFTEEMRDDAIARARLSPDAVVADVGTGTGFVARGLAALAAKVYGFDESPEMLAVAKKNLSGFANVELREARGNELPLQDGTLDAVFANMYLHHTPDPAAAIVEMARLLKPGGSLIVTDADEHGQVWMREAMADLWLGFRRGDVRAWFEAAGLTDISVDCAKGSCCTETPDGRPLTIGIFLAMGTKGPSSGMTSA